MAQGTKKLYAFLLHLGVLLCLSFPNSSTWPRPPTFLPETNELPRSPREVLLGLSAMRNPGRKLKAIHSPHPGPVPRESELCSWDQRTHVHPAPSEEPVSRFWLLSQFLSPVGSVGSLWGCSGGGKTRELKQFPSRDLLGSSYTETYSAANGSEVTEQLHGQVCARTAFPGPVRPWQQDL